MHHILITGGCGFIGSNLAVAFREAGHRVTVLDNLSRRGSKWILERIRSFDITFVHGDIRRPNELAALGSDFDLMIECSAEPSVLVGAQGGDAAFMVENNLVGALNCFEWARHRRIPVIFFSTSRVYPYDAVNAIPCHETDTRFDMVGGGRGYSPDGIDTDFPMDGARSLYGATKWAAEMVLQEYAHQYDLPVIINRCGVVAGPWQMGKVDQGVFTHWLICHMADRPLSYIGFGGAGKQVRDVLHIDDLTDLIMRQSERIGEFRGALFQAAGSTVSNLSLCQATRWCRELTGRSLKIGSVPDNRPMDVRWMVLNIRHTTDVFDWVPQRSADMVMSDTYQWLREHRAQLDFLAGEP